MLTGARSAIRAWYEGKFVPHPNEPGSALIFTGGDYQRHWTAALTRHLVGFSGAHWQWLLGFLLALVGLIVHAHK